MSRETKMARNMKKLIRRYVDKHYPDEVDQLMEKTENYYQKFKSDVPDIGGDANMLAGNLGNVPKRLNKEKSEQKRKY